MASSKNERATDLIVAQSNPKVRYAINTRVTYESVFRHFSRHLAEHGITTVKQFKAVLHTTHNLESVRRRKKLDAQRDGRRKEVSQPPPKNGKMAGMKTTGKR